MYRRTTSLLLATMMLAMLRTGASYGWEAADAGRWQALPGFDGIAIERIDDLCWHQDRLYATGAHVVPQDDGLSDRHVQAVLVWQDEQWHHVRDLGNLLGWQLASDGRDLAVVQGGTVHRWRDGSWRRFEGGFDGRVEVATYWGDTLVIGGFVGDLGSREKHFLMQWDEGVWRPLGGGVGGVPEPQVTALLSRDDDLWVAGRFLRAGAQMAGNVARWDGRAWDVFAGGADGEVVAMSSCGNGVAIAGVFAHVGGQDCPGLAAWREGAWQPLPALPLDAPSPTSGLVCPVPAVTRLADLRDGLVAFGHFTFVDAHGDTARNVAVLSDGQWCRWLPGERLLRRPLSPRQNEEGVGIRGLLEVGDVAVDGDRVAVAGEGLPNEALVALVRDDVAWIAYPRVSPRSRIRLAEWRDTPLLLGSEYVGAHRTGGLARLVEDRWELLGDWLGTGDDCGGRVHAVAEWHGDLVAAGSFAMVADQAVHQVAAFDGRTWRPLGEGFARVELADARLLPRRDDLVVFGAVGWPGHESVDCRRWDGRTWAVVPLPENSSRQWESWTVAAAGDTLWALTQRTMEHRKPGDPWRDLYALTDTSWTLLASFHDPGPRSLAYWNGALHGAMDVEHGQAYRLVRWDGAAWQNALAQDLIKPEPGWDVQFLADGRCLFPGQTSTLCWDGAEWSAWPGAENRRVNVSYRGGRLLRLQDRRPETCDIWTGPLPSPDPQLQPPEPVVTAYRERQKIARDDLPRLRPEADSHWCFHDQGGIEPPGRISARGRQGLEMVGAVDLAYEFQTEAPSWYRLTGKIRNRSAARHCSVYLNNGNSNQLSHAIGDGNLCRDDAPSGDGEIELLVPVTNDSLAGSIWFSQFGGESRVEKLALGSSPDLFVETLDKFRRTLQKRWRPPVGGGPVMPAALTPAIERAARGTFSLSGADSLVLAMVAAIGDQRIWVEGSTAWRPKLSPERSLPADAGWREQDRRRRYSAPENLDPCEPLPDDVTAWLAGDLAYQRCPSPEELATDADWLLVPRVWTLQAKGLVLDLREPDDSTRCRGERVCHALWCLGAGDVRWARARDSGGKAYRWWDLAGMLRGSELPRVDDLPVVVLVSPHTDGAHALLAEALSRLANVTLVGETTAPLPARDEAVRVPWGDWWLMIPAGTWEGPDGHTLTDRRISPDVTWSADDTDGLIEQAHGIVAAFAAQSR